MNLPTTFTTFGYAFRNKDWLVKTAGSHTADWSSICCHLENLSTIQCYFSSRTSDGNTDIFLCVGT